ncbi:MAG TPA: PAS domain S-box protein [Rhodothermales bacterium]|nr:PAS domain S-box protein [Rhodothermales bacterium]
MDHRGHGSHTALLHLARAVLQATSAALYQIHAEGELELLVASGALAPSHLQRDLLDALKTNDGLLLIENGTRHPAWARLVSDASADAVACALVRRGKEPVGIVLALRSTAFKPQHREGLAQVAEVAAGLFEQPLAAKGSEQESSLYLLDQHPEGSEEHYRAFVAQSSEGIWCYAFDAPIPLDMPVEEQVHRALAGRLVVCNEAMARMYGFEHAEALKADLLFRRIPLDALITQENILRFRQGGYRASNIETLEYDREGKECYFLVNVVGIVEGAHLVRVWGSQVDITARKQAEQAFRDSEERWHRLVERHPQPILLTREGIILDMNQAGLDLLGLTSQEEAHGRRLHDFVAPEMHDVLDERIGAVGQDRIEAPRRYKVLTQRGEARYIEAFSLPIVYERQNVAQSIWRDVTEQVHAETALRESEHLLSSINESISEGIYRSTWTGELLYVNDPLVRMFGYQSAEEMSAVAQPGMFYRDPTQRETLIALMQKDQGFKNQEIEFVRKDGSSFWGLMSASVMLDENGEIRFFTGAITDITDRRAAAQALQASEERWRTLVESHPEPIVITQGERILYANEATVQILRADSAGALYNRTVSEFIAPEYEQVRAERTQARARGEVVKPMEYRIFDVKGQERYVESIAVPTTYAGHIATQVVMRDTTERHRYEQALIEAREQALEMARLKSAFLANMSHEIRTPLTAIIGFADVLAEEVHDENREFAQLIRQSGQRLMETLNSVLDLAQIESGSIELSPACINVVKTVWQVLNLFTVQAQQQGLDLQLDAPDDHVHAWLDAGALSRSLTNLVANAIKFTTTGYIRVVIATDQEGLELRVEDTGVGIGKAFMAKIFKEFYQESSGTTRGYEGSGLGLSITRRLVNLMEGTIHVESEKGKGSVFTLQFPASVLRKTAPIEEEARVG